MKLRGYAFGVRQLSIVLLFGLSLGLGFNACSKGGTGVGTAPEDTPDCPLEQPSPGTPCSALQICGYPLCTDASTCSPTRWAYCPGGTDATWEIQIRTDASIPQPETSEPKDTRSDGSDSDVAEDARDAEVSLDTADSNQDSALDTDVDTGDDGTLQDSNNDADASTGQDANDAQG